MPIYEFECAHGHRFEKIMTISRAESTVSIPCEGPCQYCVDNNCVEQLPAHGCLCAAKRVEFSTFVPHFAPGGAGGFHKPGVAKMVGRADVTKHINNVTGGKGLHGLVKGGSTARVGG